MSIERVRLWVKGHMGSGVTEANCSEAGGPCNDPAGGFISATRANNTHFDPYTRTPTPWTIIQSDTLQVVAGWGPLKLTHTSTQQTGSNGGKIALNDLLTIRKGSGYK